MSRPHGEPHGGIAAATLREMGFMGAIALDGGIKAWREAGHPLEKAAPAR